MSFHRREKYYFRCRIFTDGSKIDMLDISANIKEEVIWTQLKKTYDMSKSLNPMAEYYNVYLSVHQLDDGSWVVNNEVDEDEKS